MLCTPDPEPQQETESDMPLSVSCRCTGQHWPALGMGALVSTDLSHVTCDASPLGGGRH